MVDENAANCLHPNTIGGFPAVEQYEPTLLGYGGAGLPYIEAHIENRSKNKKRYQPSKYSKRRKYHVVKSSSLGRSVRD
jgi:hypothetical protein